MARAPVSKTGGWGFESLHSCQPQKRGPGEILRKNNKFSAWSGNEQYAPANRGRGHLAIRKTSTS
jgi:hypothetical protein